MFIYFVGLKTKTSCAVRTKLADIWSSCNFTEEVKFVNSRWCCFLTRGAGCTMTFGKTQTNLEESHLEFWQQLQGCDGLGRVLSDLQRDFAGEFGPGQPSREPLSVGGMWPCQAACIIPKMLGRSWSHEQPLCTKGQSALPWKEDNNELQEFLALHSWSKPHVKPFCWFQAGFGLVIGGKEI